MSPINALTRAIVLAAEAHDGQVDKSGVPYIFHPLAVMAQIQHLGASEEAQIAAVLHDVVEDTDVSLNEIYILFGEGVTRKVDRLTHHKGTSREMYQHEILHSGDIEILMIKAADIQHNLSRLENLSEEEQVRLVKKYTAFLADLIDGMKALR